MAGRKGYYDTEETTGISIQCSADTTGFWDLTTITTSEEEGDHVSISSSVR